MYSSSNPKAKTYSIDEYDIIFGAFLGCPATLRIINRTDRNDSINILRGRSDKTMREVENYFTGDKPNFDGIINALKNDRGTACQEAADKLSSILKKVDQEVKVEPPRYTFM